MTVEIATKMKTFFPNLILFFKEPKRFMTQFQEYPTLKMPFVIIFFMSAVVFVSTIIYPPVSPNSLRNENVSKIFATIYPFFMGIVVFVAGWLVLILEGLWVKFCFHVLRVKAIFISIISLMAYSYVPLLLIQSFEIFWPDILVISRTDAGLPLVYYRISLVSLFIDYIRSYPILFYFLCGINPFSMWSFFLKVIAVKSMGKISYWMSLLIVFFFWVAFSGAYAYMLTRGR